MVTAYVIVDELLGAAGHRSHPLAGVPDSEVLTVAVVAAACSQNHHAVALAVMPKGYLGGRLSLSCFNRRLHALADRFGLLLEVLGQLYATGEAFVLDSLPLPVCRRVRARRCRKVRGRAFCGYCAAKREKFFGWRLHLVTTPAPDRGHQQPARSHGDPAPARADQRRLRAQGPRLARRPCPAQRQPAITVVFLSSPITFYGRESKPVSIVVADSR